MENLRKIALAGLTVLAFAGCYANYPQQFSGKFRGYDAKVNIYSNGSRDVTIKDKAGSRGWPLEVNTVIGDDYKGDSAFEVIYFNDINVRPGTLEMFKYNPIAKYANSDSLNAAADEVMRQSAEEVSKK